MHSSLSLEKGSSATKPSLGTEVTSKSSSVTYLRPSFTSLFLRPHHSDAGFPWVQTHKAARAPGDHLGSASPTLRVLAKPSPQMATG